MTEKGGLMKILIGVAFILMGLSLIYTFDFINYFLLMVFTLIIIKKIIEKAYFTAGIFFLIDLYYINQIFDLNLKITTSQVLAIVLILIGITTIFGKRH